MLSAHSWKRASTRRQSSLHLKSRAIAGGICQAAHHASLRRPSRPPLLHAFQSEQGDDLQGLFAPHAGPDRGWALAAIAGTLSFELFKRALVRDLVLERVDPVLFGLSYDYVGEMSETVAHIWPPMPKGCVLSRLPALHEVIHEFQTRDKPGIRDYLALLLDAMTPPQRWALLKLGTSTLRIGMSARFVKHVLADYGGVSVAEIEEDVGMRRSRLISTSSPGWRREGRSPAP